MESRIRDILDDHREIGLRRMIGAIICALLFRKKDHGRKFRFEDGDTVTHWNAPDVLRRHFRGDFLQPDTDEDTIEDDSFEELTDEELDSIEGVTNEGFDSVEEEPDSLEEGLIPFEYFAETDIQHHERRKSS